jgi:glycosyltransferase involved in cell wall biosynthesis
MQKVLIITYYWPPSGGPGVQRWLKFAKYLSHFDITPIVLSVKKEKATYPVIDNSLENETKGIKVYYTNSVEPFGIFKKVSGIKKIPYGGNEIETSNNFSKTIIQFLRGNLFIPDPRRGWNYFAIKKANEIIKKYAIETVITTSPPHSTQLIGLNLKKRHNIKWIADLRDPWTKIFYYKNFLHSPIAKWLDSYYEKKVLLNADKLITVSNSLKQEYVSLLKRDISSKISVIPNGFDEDDFISKTRLKPKEFTITYTGSISNSYNLGGFLKALELLQKEGNKFKLRIIGYIHPDIQQQIESNSPDQTLEIINYVDHSKAIDYLLNSSLLLLLIPQLENNKGILTGKLFEYLAAQKPIVCLGPENGDAAKIISDCKAGKTFEYERADEIYAFIKENIYTEEAHSNDESYLSYSRKNLSHALSKLIRVC